MTASHDSLRALYRAFNSRQIDAILPSLHSEVVWPNGMEGGDMQGHAAIREYWTRQWSQINPVVEPVDLVTLDDGTVRVGVHQVVHSLDGQLLIDQKVFHTYHFRDGLVDGMTITAVEEAA